MAMSDEEALLVNTVVHILQDNHVSGMSAC